MSSSADIPTTFYSMYERKKVEINPDSVQVKAYTNAKTGNVRYQAVAQDGQGRKLYKFISKPVGEALVAGGKKIE